MLKYALPKKSNVELKELLDNNDLDTIILSHIKLAKSLANKFGKDDEYFDAAVYGLVLGVNRLKDLEHDNITGYLVHWMNRHIREVKSPGIPIDFDPPVDWHVDDIDDMLSGLSDLDKCIISMKYYGFTNEEVCKHLETTQWFIQKAKENLKILLSKPMAKS